MTKVIEYFFRFSNEQQVSYDNGELLANYAVTHKLLKEPQ